MKLFIKIKDGQPFEHPILEDNFASAFPNIDINNLPPEFAEFVRVSAPEVGVYEVLIQPTYQWDNGKVKDVWSKRPMTEEEKQNKINSYKASWQQAFNYTSWTFDEAQCKYVPPTPRPGTNYIWDEPTLSWKLNT